MLIKEVKATIVLDSRKEKTIEITVNKSEESISSAPYGASRGKHEKKPFKNKIENDVKTINSLKPNFLGEIEKFEDLEKIEEKIKNKIGANTLFALESSILKALAEQKCQELWKILNPNLNTKHVKFPRLLSNTIGGGSHSKAFKIKPDFQEFLVTCDKNPNLCKLINERCYEQARKIISNIKGIKENEVKTNDEHALQIDSENEKVLEIMKNVQENVFEQSATHIDLGLDVAASQFFKNGKYYYKNKKSIKTREEQINYIIELAKKYNIFYIEDPLDEEDFQGFKEINEKAGCLIVGDDLTTTNLERLEKAIKMKAISGMIIKPNQIGSLIEVKKVFELCKQNNITTFVSHRSGETFDFFISDLAFAFQADFIKIPVIGEERIEKVNRLKRIEESLK